MRVLVTGGTGFIGSHVIEHLVQKGHEVTSLSLSSRLPARLSSSVQVVHGNLMDKRILDSCLKEVECIVHLAWSSLPHSTIECPDVDIEQNVLSSVALLEQAHKYGVEKAVFLSSGGTVYGISDELPIHEEHPCAPICSYGITKAATENFFKLYHQVYGMNGAVLRVSNVYGPRHKASSGQGVVGVWLDHCMRREPIEVFGDGGVIRDYIYVTDVAKAVVAAVEKNQSLGVLNIGTGKGTSLQELLNFMEGVIGFIPEVRFSPQRVFDVPENILDASRAKTSLDWEPLVGLPEGIELTWNWLQQHQSTMSRA